MAVILEANYSKKLGLPNFSSHQYSVTIRTELTDLAQVEAESAKLYRTLQDAVDREIQEVGFMPDATTYGMNAPASNGTVEPRNGNGHSEPARRPVHPNGNGRDTGAWRCSEKQRDFIEKIVRENGINKNDAENLSLDLFGVGVRALDRLQASGFIDELLERFGGKPRGQKRPYRRERAPVHGNDQ